MDNLSEFTKWINHRAYAPHPCIMLPPQSLDDFPELTNVENPLPFLWLIHSQKFVLSGPFTWAFFFIFRKENLKKLQQLLHLADYSLLGLEVKS